MMDDLKLAETFVRCFCNADIEGIRSVIADDFCLRGPLFEFDSAAAYLSSLQGDLRADPRAKTVASFSNDELVAVFYTYHGNNIAQLFRCRDGKICDTTLVFDTRKHLES